MGGRLLAPLLALLLALVCRPGHAETVSIPRIAEERVVLHTQAGPIVLALYPDIAPGHVRRILELVRAGVYDSTHFYRVEPGFLIQLSSALDRTRALTPAQRSLLQPLKAELSGLKHRAGVLSMAHQDGAPDSAESSFSILLGDAPHLDGEYTVFGQVQSGFEVLEEISKVPRTREQRPIARLGIDHAEVVSSAPELHRLAAVRATPFSVPAALDGTSLAQDEPLNPWGQSGGYLVILCLNLAAYLGRTKLSPRSAAAVQLMTVLACVFCLFVALSSLSGLHSVRAVVVFCGLLATFKLMGTMESAP